MQITLGITTFMGEGGNDASGWALVLLPFLGTLAGALIALLGIRWQLQHQETARQAARHDAARDRQRAALEAMQEAVNEFAVERMPDMGADTLEGRPTATDGALGLLGRTKLTIARVHDDEARRLADMTCQFALAFLNVKTRDEILTVSGGVRDAVDKMHERVGRLLREFDEE
jgi:hypothetical protein